MGMIITLSGLLNPSGVIYGALWSAAATFGANAGLLFMPNFARNDTADANEPFRLTRTGAWIAAGAVSTLLLFAILGPGIPR